MRIDNQRRSDNFEDRGRGSGGGQGVAGAAAVGIFRLFGLRGLIIVALVLAGIYFFGGAGLRSMVFGGAAGPGGQGEGQVCATEAQACDFSRAVLGSTEDVWNAQFQAGHLPNYGHALPTAYENPTLDVYSQSIGTGCGGATSAVGPFYCPEDHKLYIDPSFYQMMQSRLNAPGQFAQAYVIAHEVGHHVQNLIGAMDAGPNGESRNEHSVRVELQADCFAGVWGNSAKSQLQITEADMTQALNAAHNIGDDTLQQQGQGYTDPRSYTHGTSEQRMRWFRRGFDSGDARQCDTMQGAYSAL